MTRALFPTQFCCVTLVVVLSFSYARRARFEHGAMAVLCALILFACGSPEPVRGSSEPAQPELVRQLHYRWVMDASLSQVELTACSDQQNVTWVPGARTGLAQEGARTVTLGGRECIQTRYPLGGQSWRSVRRASSALTVSTASVLLRPAHLAKDVAVRIELDLPTGFHALTPWEGDGPVFETDIRALRFDGLLSIAREPPTSFVASGVKVRWHTHDGPFAQAEAWLSHGVQTVSQLWGSLPFSELHVVIVPTDTTEAVRFGFATRGPIATVLLMPGKDASIEALKRDWVLPHELSHLLFPYIKDPWLSEGLATYYQEVLRARQGAITQAQAWSNLRSGFARGRSAGAGRSLQEASASMRQTHAYTHVYWSGAAIAFLLDAHLRERGASLDAVLKPAKPDSYAQVLTAEMWLDGLEVETTARVRTWFEGTDFPPAEARLGEMLGRGEKQRPSAIANAIMSSP